MTKMKSPISQTTSSNICLISEQTYKVYMQGSIRPPIIVAFGTTVLTNVPALFGLADFTYRSVLLFLVGSIATYAFAYTGFKILKKK